MKKSLYKEVLANRMVFGEPASKDDVLCKYRLRIDHVWI